MENAATFSKRKVFKQIVNAKNLKQSYGKINSLFSTGRVMPYQKGALNYEIISLFFY
ncbi:hypothetical protein LWM68_00740 [Niabella sp. W65]|nr:hypothetical protein [Niabella sp. W65]MCH7361436.1 hypothetical protein [Niabella sp. W65]